jgi:ribosomal protein S18 acetylase RimI-like enzyme
MQRDDIRIEEYAASHAGSIAAHLFEGVPEEVVKKQREDLLNPGPDEVFSVCALSGDEVVGVCTGVRERWYGSRHRIEMVQVVVREDFRGQGVARSMMAAVARHFSSRGVEIVQISAEATNEPAIAAYERIGFRKFGILENGIKHDGQYSDETLLAMSVVDLS